MIKNSDKIKKEYLNDKVLENFYSWKVVNPKIKKIG